MQVLAEDIRSSGTGVTGAVSHLEIELRSLEKQQTLLTTEAFFGPLTFHLAMLRMKSKHLQVLSYIHSSCHSSLMLSQWNITKHEL